MTPPQIYYETLITNNFKLTEEAVIHPAESGLPVQA